MAQFHMSLNFQLLQYQAEFTIIELLQRIYGCKENDFNQIIKPTLTYGIFSSSRNTNKVDKILYKQIELFSLRLLIIQKPAEHYSIGFFCCLSRCILFKAPAS